MEYTLVSAVLSMLVVVTTAAPAATVCSMFSLETTQFMRFSSDGSISADGHFRTPEADLYVHYLNDKHLRIESVKTSSVCFLTYQGGKFQGGEPVNGNEVFEMIHVGGDNSNIIALRVVNANQPTESGSASGSGETPQEESEVDSENCYLGFSVVDNQPSCYSSTDFAATRFVLIH